MFRQIAHKPYLWLWYAIPLIFVLFSFHSGSAIDLQFHNTYLVIATLHIGILFVIYLALLGLLYWLFRSINLIKWLTISHVLLSLGMAIGLGVFVLIYQNYYFSFDSVPDLYKTGILMFTYLSQLLFVINILASVLKNKRDN